MTTNKLELGTNEHGIRFEWTPTAGSHVAADGELAVNIWNAEWDEAAWIELNAGDALELAQWINERLGRD